MSLYREWAPAPHSLAAIWKIEEPEDFFVDRVGFRPDIKVEKRRLEHLAGRFLLLHLKDDFPVLTIEKDAHDKPRIDGNRYRFSISHSYPYVAALISDTHECGIDIQCWHPRMGTLQHKFLSPREQDLFGDDPRRITLAWSAKEAAYKWQGLRGVEFIDHLPVISLEGDEQLVIQLQLPDPTYDLTVHTRLEEDFSLAWCL